MLSRLVRIINVSIAVLILLMLGMVYWLAVRPLPKTDGEITAPIGAAATVKRDARGVPHIEAGSWQDAIFLQGYVTAQDRLWQMDSLRRYGAGDLSEVFGRGTLGLDRHSRSMRMRAIAEADVLQLSKEDRAVMVEYARGVNYYIDTHRGNYSLEFSIPTRSYNPRPWTLADSMLIGLVMFRDLTDAAEFEFNKGLLFDATADLAKAKTLFPALEGQDVSPGSNAWAVSGARAAGGRPILANDTHLAYGIPGSWHLIHLKAPGYEASGATFPGLPCVIIGHNSQIAWGVTNLEADVQDSYSEQIDESNGRYLFKGQTEQALLDRQTIPVLGEKPVQFDNWVTRHGPIVLRSKGKAYSMRWSAAEGFGFPFFNVNRARNWSEFREALKVYWGPAQNFVFADKAGNIGYQATGRLPIRRNFDGDVPLDGASGEFEWDGYIPFDRLPSIFNPASGMIATSNQNPFPPGYPNRITGPFADRYRVQQVRALLSAKSKLDVNDMLAVEKDVYSAYDHFLAGQMVRAIRNKGSKDDLLTAASESLRNWNGQMEKSLAAPAVTELVSNELRKSMTGLLALKPKQSMPELQPRPQIIETLLRERPSGWVPNDDWDAWLVERSAAALQHGRQRLGSPISQWRWGKLLQWHFEHPIGKNLPLIDGFFNIGPVEMSGSGTTVKQTTQTLGPSERMVIDLGNLDQSVMNLVAGESGFVVSGHYKDQWQAYYTGKSFPMEFDHVEAKEVLRVQPAAR